MLNYWFIVCKKCNCLISGEEMYIGAAPTWVFSCQCPKEPGVLILSPTDHPDWVELKNGEAVHDQMKQEYNFVVSAMQGILWVNLNETQPPVGTADVLLLSKDGCVYVGNRSSAEQFKAVTRAELQDDGYFRQLRTTINQSYFSHWSPIGFSFNPDDWKPITGWAIVHKPESENGSHDAPTDSSVRG